MNLDRVQFKTDDLVEVVQSKVQEPASSKKWAFRFHKNRTLVLTAE
jgi:hypothetical protein